MTDNVSGTFAGKVVVVTGAASGIGKATALKFLAQGASVVWSDQDEGTLKDAMAGAPEDRSVACIVDQSQPSEAARSIDTALERFGRLDVLVNNAGTTVLGTVLDNSIEDWHRVAAVNIDGALFSSKAALPHLIKSGGCIVNTASVSGTGGDWNTTLYNVSKGAVVNMTRALALAHGPDGVRVNAICPSVTHTGMTDGMMDNKEYLDKLVSAIPLRRIGQPEDMASAIVFLASDAAGFISGAILPVDGGITAGNGQPPFPS